jgi:hypothetical protein
MERLSERLSACGELFVFQYAAASGWFVSLPVKWLNRNYRAKHSHQQPPEVPDS